MTCKNTLFNQEKNLLTPPYYYTIARHK